LKNFTYVIIDDNQDNALKTKATAESFQNLHFLAVADNYDDGLDVVLEQNPDIIFLEIDPQDKESKLSLAFINELHRYLTVVPKIFITTTNDALCLEAFKYGVFDYFIKPLETKELRKSLFRLEKEFGGAVIATAVPQIITNSVPVNSIIVSENQGSNSETEIKDIELVASSDASEAIQVIEQEIQVIVPEETEAEEKVVESEIANEEPVSNESLVEPKDSKTVSFIQTENTKEKPLIICVKSYGDYRYIDATDICYLQADNNSTDIHLNTGEMITAFKTLKHFEGVMVHPFVRIHNSYIVNIDYVSRIHTGNAVCHIKGTTTKLPFSKSYKENIDAIIATIAAGNYLEI
jgi:DNA-binding LytR/AlgR family response regulator